MAKREIGEINAGSMADIAFLLLIFFLVTTTIEVDSGISRNMPLQTDQPPTPPVPERNVLKILANSEDKLMVEDREIEIGELEEVVLSFYTANIYSNDQDATMPNYRTIDVPTCQMEIARISAQSSSGSSQQRELKKWQTKLPLCNLHDGGSYREIHKSALIQIKNQGNTSYGLYIQIQNTLKKVINNLRVEKARELWEVDYFKLDPTKPADQTRIEMLRILVPERIIEAKIDRG